MAALQPMNAAFKVQGHSPRGKDSLDDTPDSNPTPIPTERSNISTKSSGEHVRWSIQDIKKEQFGKLRVKRKPGFCLISHQKPGTAKIPNTLSHFDRLPNAPSLQDVKMMEEIVRKVPDKALLDIFRSHYAKVGDHTRDEYFRRAIRWRRGTADVSEKDHCIICRLQRLSSRPIQTEYDKIVSSMMLYPQDYYNRYSREEKQVENSFEAPHQSGLIQICKKAELALKSPRPMPTPPPPPPVSVLESLPPLTPSVEEDSEYSESRTERLMQMYLAPIRRSVHSQCKPHSPNFMAGSDIPPSDLAFVYRKKALRGCFQRKHIPDPEGSCDKVDHHVSYPVDALGMQFTIPVYNSHFRPKAPTPSRQNLAMDTRRERRPPKSLPPIQVL